MVAQQRKYLLELPNFCGKGLGNFLSTFSNHTRSLCYIRFDICFSWQFTKKWIVNLEYVVSSPVHIFKNVLFSGRAVRNALSSVRLPSRTAEGAYSDAQNEVYWAV